MPIRARKLISGILLPALAIPFLSIPATASVPASQPVLSAAPSPEWTALFDRAGTTGWLAADGIYSVAVDGVDDLSSATDSTKTLFFFSDTILGKSANSGNIVSYYGMANHSAALLVGNQPDANQIQFYYGSKGNMQTSRNLNLFEQNQWLFDCFATGNSVYAIAFSQQDWKPASIDLIRVPLKEDGTPDFAAQKRTRQVKQLLKKLPNFDYAYGMAVLPNTESAGVPNPDGYIYIYGYRDNFAAFSQKDLIVSRIHETEFPDWGKLRYWNGTDWVEDIESSALILERVSCEVSVSPITCGPYKGKYIAVYTQDVQSNRIMYAIGDSPVGPFDTPVQCYTVPETGKTATGGAGTLYTYNAKAHPHLSAPGKLLISYNVNVNGIDHATNTADYRPRFIELDLQATAEELEAMRPSENASPQPTPPVTTSPDSASPSAPTNETAFPWHSIWIGAGVSAALAAICGGVIFALRKRKKR